uniref:Gag-pol polyprotein n=1 Tax=Caenorhabditis tropicalis TaxID=1561998 RepID=A0A1I7T5T4_9PELO
MAAAAAASSNPAAMEQAQDEMRQVLRQMGMQLNEERYELRNIQQQQNHPEMRRNAPNHVIYVRRIGPDNEAEEFEQWYEAPQVFNRVIRVEQQPMVIAPESDDEDEEDHNLMVGMNLHVNRRPPPAPTPTQLEIFQHCMSAGFFVATVEALSDRGDVNIQELRKFSLEKVEELIKSAEQPGVFEPEVEEQIICGTPKIQRDVRRMSKHVGYYKELIAKVLEEFDGSFLRLNKMRQATGIIKGLMVLLGKPIYNNTTTLTPGNHDVDIDIFTVNTNLFIEMLENYE